MGHTGNGLHDLVNSCVKFLRIDGAGFIRVKRGENLVGSSAEHGRANQAIEETHGCGYYRISESDTAQSFFKFKNGDSSVSVARV